MFLTGPALQATPSTAGPVLLSLPGEEGEGDEAVDGDRHHQRQEGVEGWGRTTSTPLTPPPLPT